MAIVRQFLGEILGRGIGSRVRDAKRELTLRYRRYRSFDRIYGVDTGGTIEPEDLRVPSINRAHGTAYQPTPTRVCREFLRRLPVNHRDYVFIDLGSGKGRTLLLASHYPFKKIIGVEFSPELHGIAIDNVAKFRSRSQRCFDIDPILMDAAEYQPPAEPIVFFLFNPFGPDLMRRVLANIRRSLMNEPRDVLFVYYNPRHAEIFGELGFYRLIRVEVEQGVDSAWADL